MIKENSLVEYLGLTEEDLATGNYKEYLLNGEYLWTLLHKAKPFNGKEQRNAMWLINNCSLYEFLTYARMCEHMTKDTYETLINFCHEYLDDDLENSGFADMIVEYFIEI